MYVPKWVLLFPVVVVAVMAWREFPALTRYLKTVRM